MSTDSLLRFITAGSVDDGKSTLIGRLLFDSQTLLADQIESLYKGQRSQNGTPDFSLLTDGLAAEREQGITIDVAYRYFATPKRKFIIADTPGHEQYTRNMVTGASTADAAIILIDATRLELSVEPISLLTQTKRHSALLSMLGTKHIIVAVNKLDLVDYDETVFNRIVHAYQHLAEHLNLKDVHFLPISALHGVNMVSNSEHTPWYQGPALLPLLESLPTQRSGDTEHSEQAIFPVQRVARQDGSSADDFRGYQGRLDSGRLHVGQVVRLEPSGRSSTIKAIYGPSQEQDEALAGEVLTVTLNDDIDISRGDTIVDASSPLQSSQFISASLAWMDEKPLNLARRYWLKHGNQTTYAKIKSLDYLWEVSSLGHTEDADTLKMNDIGRVHISLQKPITATSYEDNQASGAFILIDEATNHTVAAGMIAQADDSGTWVI